MSYTLGTPPSPRPSYSELADFLEVECLLSTTRSFSITEAAQQMGIVDDESTPEDEEDDSLEDVRNALSIIEDRKRMTNNNYPFTSSILSIEIDNNCDSLVADVYVFLLLATRENMRAKKKVDDLDGTLLFERLCAEILKNYFGEHSSTLILGTGRTEAGGFLEKLQIMLNSFSEKGYQITQNPLNPYYKDAGIDVVAFIPFSDDRHGHLVFFAQCKTGTSWESAPPCVRPGLLIDYIQPTIIPTPGKMVLVADGYHEKDWRDKIKLIEGIFFDRCRLMAFLPKTIDLQLAKDIHSWNNGVLSRYY